MRNFKEILIEDKLRENILKENINVLNKIKDWFGPYDVYATMDNPLSLIWEKQLDESLVKTYDIEAAKRHICKFFNLPEKYFQIHKNEYNTYCFIMFPQKDNSLEEIIKAMEWYGYFSTMKKIQPLSNGWYVIKFESKFEKDANELLKTEKFLIHITPFKYKDKILKNGFIPKSKNKKFNYPDRTYFMLGSTNPVETLKLSRKLSQVENNNKKTEYCAFRIDVNKIPSNVSFHLDPNMEGAVWTSDNITPNAIKDFIILKIDFFINRG